MSNPDRSRAETLLERAQQGHGDALGQLLERYRNYMSMLVRMSMPAELQPKVDPSDIVQEAYLQVHRGFDQFRGSTEGEFLCWLKTILVHGLAAQRRRYMGNAKRDVRREAELRSVIDRSSSTLSHAIVAGDLSPSECAQQHERGVILANAMAHLSPDHREVIVLHNLEERTFGEIAIQLGRSVNSARCLWARAMRNLIGMLNTGDGSSPA